MLTGLELLIALLAVVVGATIMGTVSFGMGLVVAPVLLLFLDPKAAIVTVNAIIPILLLFVPAYHLAAPEVQPSKGGWLLAASWQCLSGY